VVNTKSVLLVDDEIGILDLLCDEIREMGFDADSAENAQVALTKIQQKNYHLMITDFTMPGTNGLELIQALRKQGFTFPVILLLTATNINHNQLKELNVSCTLSKPFDYDTLSKKVKELLR
jgi:DNA-binding response OmpR family regulator